MRVIRVSGDSRHVGLASLGSPVAVERQRAQLKGLVLMGPGLVGVGVVRSKGVDKARPPDSDTYRLEKADGETRKRAEVGPLGVYWKISP